MDTVIRGATIVDGTGKKAFLADVGIVGKKIARVGKIEEKGAREISANGKLLIPGFVDPHSHVDAGVFTECFARNRIVQGITSDFVGHCGATPAPFCAERGDVLQRIYYDLTGLTKRFEWKWTDVDSYIKAIEATKPSSNIATLVGHGTLRAYVMGEEPRKATERELDAMCELLDACLCQGAMGLGLGLNNMPGLYSDTDELIALAKVCKKHDAIVVAHRRSESGTAVEAVEEMIRVTEATGVRMNIAHVKVMGRDNWGKAKTILALIDDAAARGLDVTFDVYPYIYSFGQLGMIFPRWLFTPGWAKMKETISDKAFRRKLIDDMQNGREDCFYTDAGGADGVQVVQCDDPRYNGKTLREIGEIIGEDPLECALRLIEKSDYTVMGFFAFQNEAEMDSIVLHKNAMILSDGVPSYGHNHPRYMGAFAHYLEHYVKETGALTLEEAVRRVTSMPARRYRFNGRGVVEEGAFADLALLDWEKFHDNCTYADPIRKADGVEAVFLNGTLAAERGRYLGQGVGEVLRRGK